MKINPRYLKLEKEYAEADKQYKRAYTHWLNNPTLQNEKAKNTAESHMNAIWNILQNVPGWIEDEQ